MIAGDLIRKVRDALQDDNKVRWSDDDLLDYLNSAMLMLATVRPDSSSKNVAHKLNAGTKQAIPADGLRFIKISRNLGADGTTPGYPVTDTKIDTLNALSRTWHKKSGKTSVSSYAFDVKIPKEFYCYPPASSSVNVYVDLYYSMTPRVITDIEDVDPLTPDDIYDPVIRTWMLRDAFAKELSSVTSQQLSARYENSFYQSLGIKSKVDLNISPNKIKEVNVT